jgi:hypothetical protein
VKSAENRLLDAAVAVLKKAGWNPVVIGGIQVRQEPFAPKYTYYLTVGFTGSKVEDNGKIRGVHKGSRRANKGRNRKNTKAIQGK